MAYLIGEKLKFGIASPETGIFVDSIETKWQGEWKKWKANTGKTCTILLVEETLSVQMSGAVPQEGEKIIKGADALVLNNTLPDLWHEKPAATTVVCEDVSHSWSNEDFAKQNVTATVYAFGDEDEVDEGVA